MKESQRKEDGPVSDGHRLSLSAWCVAAAFGTYFCMYAFRKPFTAAGYTDVVVGGMGFKSVLVTAQVMGYTVSKFLGIKVVAETQPHRRAALLLGLIAVAELALLLFGLTPAPWSLVWLFCNGVPLGMVFGLVIGFLEGRRHTEALTAGLCSSFIVADGVTKSVGAVLLRLGVSEYWMPALTGLLFVPPLLFFTWMLARIPRPSRQDIAARSERAPMNARERWSFFRRYAVGLSLLILVYLLITILRSFRADFAPEIWAGLQETVPPGIFAWSESAVAVGVLVLNGCMVLLDDNRRAFFCGLGLVLAGLGLIALALAALQEGILSPFAFMVLHGIGLYLPYIAIHTTIFERLIAMTRDRGNIGYLLYLADSFGYLWLRRGTARPRRVRPDRERVDVLPQPELAPHGDESCPVGPVLALLRGTPGDAADRDASGRGERGCRHGEAGLMQRAVVFTGADRPLEIARLPAPEPRGAEVLVRVACCTLCRSDLHTRAGRRAEPTPIVLGHEIVGRIEAFGAEAPRHDGNGVPVRVGDRVSWAVAVGCGSCFFCAEDLPQKCERPYKYGHQRLTADRPWGGGLADCVLLVPGTYWLRVPDAIPDTVAAPASCATATVAALLRAGGSVAGRSVLVLGAGALGVTACAMASAAGAQAVLVSDPSPQCRERALHFGATHAFPAAAEELTAGVRDITRGRGADLVLELAGAAGTVQAGLALARTGGTVLLAGTVAPVGSVELDPENVVRRLLTIRGIHNYHPRDLAAALAFLAGPGRGFPWGSLVVAEYPLEQVEQAFAHGGREPGVRVAVVPGLHDGEEPMQ